MGTKTGIEWTDSTWSPIRARVSHDAARIAQEKGYTSLVQIATKMAGRVGQHCEYVSPGCENCYAETNNHRCLPANGTGLPYDRRSRDLVEAFVDEKQLLQPLKWKPIEAGTVGFESLVRRRRVFVENQSDLFGDWVTDEMLDRVFAMMALCPQHDFQVLTKRPARMKRYFEEMNSSVDAIKRAVNACSFATEAVHGIPSDAQFEALERIPCGLANIWLGVSVENQAAADERIPLLQQTPAAVRFLSCEPLLGPISFRWATWEDHAPHSRRVNQLPDVERGGRLLAGCVDELDGLRRIDWVIAGCESGPKRRPTPDGAFESLCKQCYRAGVPFFFKQAIVDGKLVHDPTIDGVEHKAFPESRL